MAVLPPATSSACTSSMVFPGPQRGGLDVEFAAGDQAQDLVAEPCHPHAGPRLVPSPGTSANSPEAGRHVLLVRRSRRPGRGWWSGNGRRRGPGNRSCLRPVRADLQSTVNLPGYFSELPLTLSAGRRTPQRRKASEGRGEMLERQVGSTGLDSGTGPVSNPRKRCSMRVISYNLRKHKASGELLALARNHDIDALCLQEVDSGGSARHPGPAAPGGRHQGQPAGAGHLLPHQPLHGAGHAVLRPEEVDA